MNHVATLRALLAAATPGPWNADRRHPTDGDIAYVDGADMRYDEVALLCAREGTVDRDNAALIAAAINALPRLIAVCEAAEALRAASHHPFGDGNEADAEMVLFAALAALEEVKP